MDIQHSELPIRVVARRTGLSQHTIRAWERRYSALTPSRTATNRRLYSEMDISRLKLLKQAVAEGHSIGRIAVLKDADLITLFEGYKTQDAIPPSRNPENIEDIIEECISAAMHLDEEELLRHLEDASVMLGAWTTLTKVVGPLLTRVGDLWHAGELRPAQEHMASEVIRGYLLKMLQSARPSSQAPCIVFATPAGQRHEFGSLMAAAAASIEGWRAVYLGADLPAVEIAGALRNVQARAVALSIIYPPDDPFLAEELVALRKYLGPEVEILAGGSSAGAYAPALNAVYAVMLTDIDALRDCLKRMRSS